MYKKLIWLVLIVLLATVTVSSAHSGRTDANGGHYNRATGGYHYHHGYEAHSHTNGACPYDDSIRASVSSGDVIGIILLVLLIVGIIMLFNITSIVDWWKENYYRDSLIGYLLCAIGFVFKTIYWILKICVYAINMLGLISAIIGIPVLLIMSFIEALEDPSPGFVIFVCCTGLLVLTIICYILYCKLYGDAKNTADRILTRLKQTKDYYALLFDAIRRTSHTGHLNDASQVSAYARKIVENLNEITSLSEQKELKKYISEEERAMLFKKINNEIQELKSLCSEIEKKYYGKACLMLPAGRTTLDTVIDVIFLTIKCRRQNSKGKYSICPAKLQRKRTVETITNTHGEQLGQTTKIKYVIVDFYFNNNHERKPIKPDEFNEFESLDQKGYITSFKDDKTEIFEVILTDEDATSDYRINQMIDTVRKVAKDDKLTSRTKKAIKGLKLSYLPPESKK